MEDGVETLTYVYRGNPINSYLERERKRERDDRRWRASSSSRVQSSGIMESAALNVPASRK